MDIQQNTWEEFYETSGENGMMQYPFGGVIEFTMGKTPNRQWGLESAPPSFEYGE